MVSRERSDLRHVPQVMVMCSGARDPCSRCACQRVALVGELAVPVDRVVAASHQLLADGRLPGPGSALDEKVSCAHTEG